MDLENCERAEECLEIEHEKLQLNVNQTGTEEMEQNYLCNPGKASDVNRKNVATTAKDSASKDLLLTFKENLSVRIPPYFTDSSLLKFIRAGNQDLKKAEALLKLKMDTREVFDMDRAMRGEYVLPEVFEKYGMVTHLGAAKDGTPLSYMAAGRGDLKGFILSLSSIEIPLMCAYYIDSDIMNMKKQYVKLGKEINEGTYILDMEEFALTENLHSYMLETAVDLLKQMQNFYPEIWKNLIFINVSMYFYIAYNMLKPILRTSLTDTFHIAPKDGSRDLLLKFVDEDVLPVFLGGSRVDSKGDPMCKEFMKLGGPIPEIYYCQNRPSIQPGDPDVENVWIYAGYCHNHSVVVREPNSRFHIQIRSEGGSLHTTHLFREFGKDPDHPNLPTANEYLNHQDESCNVRRVCPSMNLQVHVTPADYYHKAPWPGIYIWRFDNSRSWVYGRRAIFRIRVLPPS